MAPIITFTTDFGLHDPWVGSIKGAALSVNPDATLVDISHCVSAHNIIEGAFILGQAYSSYPKGTVHVAVVDPGVGGSRAPILIVTEKYFFVGPDNGIFTFAVEGEVLVTVVELTGTDFFAPRVSATFHGRDIFAPVAGHLSLGKAPTLMGEELSRAPVSLDLPAAATSGSGVVKGEVVFVDTFGNLVTNIRETEVDSLGLDPADVEVDIGWRKVLGLGSTYGDVAEGTALALVGSLGLIEIACRMTSASDKLGVSVGDPVEVRKKGF